MLRFVLLNVTSVLFTTINVLLFPLATLPLVNISAFWLLPRSLVLVSWFKTCRKQTIPFIYYIPDRIIHIVLLHLVVSSCCFVCVYWIFQLCSMWWWFMPKVIHLTIFFKPVYYKWLGHRRYLCMGLYYMSFFLKNTAWSPTQIPLTKPKMSISLWMCSFGANGSVYTLCRIYHIFFTDDWPSFRSIPSCRLFRLLNVWKLMSKTWNLRGPVSYTLQFFVSAYISYCCMLMQLKVWTDLENLLLTRVRNLKYDSWLLDSAAFKSYRMLSWKK